MYNTRQYEASKFRELIDCTCDLCSKEFKSEKRQVYKALISKSKKVFCSLECSLKARTKIKSCPICLKEFNGIKKYCSRACYNVKQSTISKYGEKIFSEEKFCLQCAKSLGVIKNDWRYKMKKTKDFCGVKCSLLYKGDLDGDEKKQVNKGPKIKKTEATSSECKFCASPYYATENASEKPEYQKLGYCSWRCRLNHDKEKVVYLTLECEMCRKNFLRTQKLQESVLKTKKHKLNFCTKSCRAKYFVTFLPVANPAGKSRAEDVFNDILDESFPDLGIKRNDRLTLPSGFELDFYFPTIKLAIELNGPVHYMPIYGQDKLDVVKSHDATKYLETHKLGISFFVIDISTIPSVKTKEYLTRYFNDHIKSVIESKLASVEKSAQLADVRNQSISDNASEAQNGSPCLY